MSTEGLRIRSSVRAVVLDPADRVLLVRFEFPTATVWATPGGGQEPGEDDTTTLHRELDEELGLGELEIGPHIWDRLHIVPFIDGKWDGQRDRIYLVRTDAFEPAPRLSWEQLRAERLHELRWWTPEEVAAAAATDDDDDDVNGNDSSDDDVNGNDSSDDDNNNKTVFAPRRFPALLADLLANGAPATPIDVGV